MLAGELFILFGLNVKDETFKAGLKHLYALKVVGSAVVGVVRSIGEGLYEMAMESGKAGTHIIGTAQALGMSTKSVQEWSYVAKQAGSNVTQFTVGISMFERNLREFAANRGGERFKDAMRDVHMSQNQAKAALVGPDGINAALFKVSDAYHRMGNTARRAAINTSLFGQRARGMAQDLGQGSDFLRRKIKEVHDLGGVIDDTSLQRLKAFDNSVEKIKTSLHGLGMQVVADLAPRFIQLVNSITRWIAENRVLISEVLSVAFNVLGTAFQMLFNIIQAIGWLIRGVMEGDTGAIILFSLLTALVVGLAAALITLALPAIIAVGTAIWVAFAPLIPILLVLAAIIAASILIYKNWDAIKEFFKSIGQWFSDKFWAVYDAVASALNAIADKGKEIWGGFLDLVEFVVEKAIAAINSIIHAMNHIPGINLGDVEMPDWAKHNTGKNPAKGTSAPAVPSGPREGYRAQQPVEEAPGATGPREGYHAPSSVSIAPTTVNIYGVKDAKEAQEHIANTIDMNHRHAAAALAGEVR